MNHYVKTRYNAKLTGVSHLVCCIKSKSNIFLSTSWDIVMAKAGLTAHNFQILEDEDKDNISTSQPFT